MALNGTGIRFVSAITVGAGSPGGSQIITAVAVPTGSYPANGELISDFFTALFALPETRAKVTLGVVPDNVVINDNLGHFWTFDPAVGTMGSLRNWTAIGAQPTEHGTGSYNATNETSAFIRLTFFFPLFGTMTR